MVLHPATRKAVFLDRDGTLNLDEGYTYQPEKLVILPNVIEGLKLLRDHGLRLLVLTNQSGVARGYYTESEMHRFHDALRQELKLDGIEIEAFYHCPFLPDAKVEEYRCDSRLRKPHPGMFEMAAQERDVDLTVSYGIGDKLADSLAAQRAGCHSILVKTGCAGGDDCPEEVTPHFVAVDLLEAARHIVARELQLEHS